MIILVKQNFKINNNNLLKRTQNEIVALVNENTRNRNNEKNIESLVKQLKELTDL